jgi:nucleotide-binding universal stress UspA family protein
MAVLATTDGSARSLRAIPHAARFARAIATDLYLLRALDPRLDAASQLNISLAAAIEAVSQRWEAELARTLCDASVDGQPVVRPMLRGEDPNDTILRVAGELGAELVAMDTRGTGAIRHALLGSCAMSLLRGTGLPVMLTGDCISPPLADDRYRLVVTSDGSPASRDILLALRPLLDGARIQLTLLRVYEPRVGDAGEAAETAACEAGLAELAELIPAGPEVTTLVRTVDGLETVDAAIIRVAAELGADAIAASTHGYSAARHLLAGSTALGVLSRSPVPVIFARAAA